MGLELQIFKIVCLASAICLCFEFTGGFLFANTSTFFAPEITVVKPNKLANLSKCMEARHFLETAKLLRVQPENGCAIFEAGRLSLHYFDSSTPTSDAHSYYREKHTSFSNKYLRKFMYLIYLAQLFSLQKMMLLYHPRSFPSCE